MRVTFDSNAWERVFDPSDQLWAGVRTALVSGAIKGFVSDAAFRIEAVRKSDRIAYFAEPKLEVTFPFDMVIKDGRPYIRFMSMGPDDAAHPGLSEIQLNKLDAALASGIKLLRSMNWLGLPTPVPINDPALFENDSDGRRKREQRQATIAYEIAKRGVGKAIFDAAGGWSAARSANKIAFRKACAEWADGELAAAHVAYRNDILCTDDRGRAAGLSIFNATNRAWLTSTYGVKFSTLEQLAANFRN